MPEIFGAALMGGGGKVFAVIDITYPAGATCTCSSGSKVLTAPDTTGQWLAVVPNAGDWVVTITQAGQDSKTETVSVVEGHAYIVELTFQLWLYNSGNECVDITGGWGAVRLKVTRNEDSINIVPTDQYTANAGLLYTNNKIDFTNIETLYVNGLNSSDIDAYFALEVAPTQTTVTGAVASANVPKRQTATASLDASALTGEYYVRVKTAWNPDSGDKGNCTIYKIWGE